MSTTATPNGNAVETPGSGTIDMKLEVVVIPVSDVDRAKRFYESLGWRLDLDFRARDDYRVIQITPPGSACSVICTGFSPRATPDRLRHRGGP